MFSYLLDIGLFHYILLASMLFFVGVFGLLWNRRNLLRSLLAIELMLLAANINFVAFSKYLNDVTGQVFTLFIFAIAAAESAIGLAIFIVYFREHNKLSLNQPELKG